MIIDDWNLLVILQLERLSSGWQRTIVCVHVGYIYMDGWLIIGYKAFFSEYGYIHITNTYLSYIYQTNIIVGQ